MNTDWTGLYTCKECLKTESRWNHTTTDHKEREELKDRRIVGENSCNSGDGTDQSGPILDVYDDYDDGYILEYKILYWLWSVVPHGQVLQQIICNKLLGKMQGIKCGLPSQFTCTIQNLVTCSTENVRSRLLFRNDDFTSVNSVLKTSMSWFPFIHVKKNSHRSFAASLYTGNW